LGLRGIIRGSPYLFALHSDGRRPSLQLSSWESSVFDIRGHGGCESMPIASLLEDQLALQKGNMADEASDDRRRSMSCLKNRSRTMPMTALISDSVGMGCMNWISSHRKCQQPVASAARSGPEKRDIEEYYLQLDSKINQTGAPVDSFFAI
jgi:hypothetical protein